MGREGGGAGREDGAASPLSGCQEMGEMGKMVEMVGGRVWKEEVWLDSGQPPPLISEEGLRDRDAWPFWPGQG